MSYYQISKLLKESIKALPKDKTKDKTKDVSFPKAKQRQHLQDYCSGFEYYKKI
jgi:hypothetical protein